jgi:hypothetical protein
MMDMLLKENEALRRLIIEKGERFNITNVRVKIKS